METNALLLLDDRRKRADGLYPVVVRIVHKRKYAQILTGLNVRREDWDHETRAVRPTYRGTESVKRLNNRIAKMRNDAMDTIFSLDERKKLGSLSASQIKGIIEGAPNRLSLFAFAERVISEMEEANQIGNARIYSTALSVFRKFNKGKDLTFEELTPAYLERFERTHLAKGNAVNGLSVYLRTIRAIYNRAIKAEVASRESYPFSAYTIKSTKPRKRAIGIEAIRRIAELEFAEGHPLFNARNYFLISFYFRGMPFVDLAHLKVRDIVDGRIQYQRQKTDKPYTVKVTSEAQAILDQYVKGKRRDDHVFPIIHRETAKLQYKDVEWDRKEYNKKLKEIAELCDIQENLTSYVSRHSFATRAKNLRIPVANISEMLGHSDLATTQNYLDNLPTDLLDDDHERIIR